MSMKHLLGLALIALAACQTIQREAPLAPEDAFAEVTFEFDT